MTQKTPNQMKVKATDAEFPSLEHEEKGYVLKVSQPAKIRSNVYSLHGMYFDDDQSGRVSLWRMYRASIHHLSSHVNVTDYSIYKGLGKDSEENLLMFAISLVEDHAVLAHLRAKWPGLLLDTAYANHLSYLRFMDLSLETDISTKFIANLLSYYMVGKPLVRLNRRMDEKLSNAHISLMDFEGQLFGILNQSESIPILPHSIESIQTSRLKIEAAKMLLSLFEEEGIFLRNVPSIPFGDSHGQNQLYESSIVQRDSKPSVTLEEACRRLSLNTPGLEIENSEKSLAAEANIVFADLEYTNAMKEKFLRYCRDLDPKTHIENYLYPPEDYAEFVRTRSKLGSPIRSMLEQLRVIRTSVEEIANPESGYIEMQQAIQMVASGKPRNDIFVREEAYSRSESWLILLDSSKSLQQNFREVKEVAVCLAELAHDLIPDQNGWSCYSFNENINVIKDFSDAYGMASKGRIGALGGGIKTLLPDALRFAAERIRKQPQEVKVILLVSDGFPLGYDGIDEDLIKVIEKLTHSGIILVGIGIGSSSIKKYFRANCIVNTPIDLMKYFVKTYIELSSLL